jgi:hypothetical protein
MAKQGAACRQFGCWLTQHLSENDKSKIWVKYYDHGDKTADCNVAAIKGFVGKEVCNGNRLADADVVLVRNGFARLLIEIEERPCSPKKILGDVLAHLMCDQYAVVRVGQRGRQDYLKVGKKETRLIIAGVLPSTGVRLEKVNSVIGPLITTPRTMRWLCRAWQAMRTKPNSTAPRT